MDAPKRWPRPSCSFMATAAGSDTVADMAVVTAATEVVDTAAVWGWGWAWEWDRHRERASPDLAAAWAAEAWGWAWAEAWVATEAAAMADTAAVTAAGIPALTPADMEADIRHPFLGVHSLLRGRLRRRRRAPRLQVPPPQAPAPISRARISGPRVTARSGRHRVPASFRIRSTTPSWSTARNKSGTRSGVCSISSTCPRGRC